MNIEEVARRIAIGTSSIRFDAMQNAYILKDYYENEVILEPITYRNLCDCLQGKTWVVTREIDATDIDVGRIGEI